MQGIIRYRNLFDMALICPISIKSFFIGIRLRIPLFAYFRLQASSVLDVSWQAKINNPTTSTINRSLFIICGRLHLHLSFLKLFNWRSN